MHLRLLGPLETIRNDQSKEHEGDIMYDWVVLRYLIFAYWPTQTGMNQPNTTRQ